MEKKPVTTAAVDIGTNSVKMVVVRREGDGFLSVLFDAATVTRLGKGIDTSGNLDESAAKRTLDALESFGARASELGATRIVAVGTAALRDAGESGAAFVEAAQTALGGTVEVITGQREAELTFYAASGDPDIVATLPANPLLVTCDLGGGSTEIVQGIGGEIFYAASLQIGAVRLTDRANLTDPVTADAFQTAALLANAAVADVPTPLPALAPVLVVSGGTAANLAAIVVAKNGAPVTLETVHGYRLTREQVEETTAYLASLTLSDRRAVPGLEPDRADVIVAGAIILGRVMAQIGVDTVTVSVRGLRYGLLYEVFGGFTLR